MLVVHIVSAWACTNQPLAPRPQVGCSTHVVQPGVKQSVFSRVFALATLKRSARHRVNPLAFGGDAQNGVTPPVGDVEASALAHLERAAERTQVDSVASMPTEGSEWTTISLDARTPPKQQRWSQRNASIPLSTDSGTRERV